jgi:hypothetical protein
MRPNRLQTLWWALGDALREVNAAIEERQLEHDPLASHIFVSLRAYDDKADTESGKRRSYHRPHSASVRGPINHCLEESVTYPQWRAFESADLDACYLRSDRAVRASGGVMSRGEASAAASRGMAPPTARSIVLRLGSAYYASSV